MTGGIAIAALVGLAVGAGIVYWLMRQSLSQQDFQHGKELRRCREDLERDFELRMQAAIEPIQRQRDRDVAQLREEVQRLKMRLATPPSPGSEPGAPEPVTPAPAPALPDPWNDRRARQTAVPEPTPVPAPAPSPAPAPAPAPAPVAMAPPKADPPSTIAPSSTTSRSLAAINLWSVRVRRQGLRADTRKQLNAVAKLARDRDVSVRLAAIRALGTSGALEALPFLTRALRDRNLAVVRAATVALNRYRNMSIPMPIASKAPKARNAKVARAGKP